MERQKSKIAKIILKDKLIGVTVPNFKTYYKVIVFKVVWNWREMTQINKIEKESTEIDPYKYTNWFLIMVQRQFNRERTVFLTNSIKITGHPKGKINDYQSKP